MSSTESILDPHRYSGFLKVLGFGAALLFGLAFLVSWLAPIQLESALRQVVASELRARADAGIERMRDTGLGRVAERMLASQSERIAQLKADIASGLPQRIDAVINDMLRPDCDCRQRLRISSTRGARLEIANLEHASERLKGFLQSQYRDLADTLHREFRIFTGANALVLLAVGLTAALRRRAGPLLLPSALLILTATVIVAGFYLFGQDWLRTILFSDYVGFGYVVWIGVVSVPLFDVAFNRGRFTVEVFNAILRSVGSTPSICTC
ncbi:hypothetical protein [Aquimonas voraii]|uniref:Uncharacterized protein n=1 Tax=Aquimonas voraii TaxID=265719 RepID=A0A1G6ULW5_9GAMM|nr:hypothetical protein [Aquimonas voraii]SDD41567.1 hypothetical protein SAMN04488509_102371 [Aquimonas voraii]